jgi:hypothetical protein
MEEQNCVNLGSIYETLPRKATSPPSYTSSWPAPSTGQTPNATLQSYSILAFLRCWECGGRCVCLLTFHMEHTGTKPRTFVICMQPNCQGGDETMVSHDLDERMMRMLSGLEQPPRLAVWVLHLLCIHRMLSSEKHAPSCLCDFLSRPKAKLPLLWRTQDSFGRKEHFSLSVFP